MADSSGGWISLGFFLVVAMIITGPLVGVYVVKPVLRVQHFKEAVCTNQRFEYAGFDETCSCGEHCSSSYPCYRVYVKYVDEVNDVEHDNVYVVENEQTLVHNRDCSIALRSACSASKQKNRKKVEESLKEKGYPLETYSCYYDPEDLEEVFIEKKFSLAGAINALFWPILIFMIGLALLTPRDKISFRCCSRTNTTRRVHSEAAEATLTGQTDISISYVPHQPNREPADDEEETGDKPPEYIDAVNLPEDPQQDAPPSYHEATHI
eukprot:m.51436 g.51436  ORF g.51436 m.51436 type:complete len:266 (+) comp34140_c0_seq3:42-839(+)